MNDQQKKSVAVFLRKAFEGTAFGIGTGSMIIAAATQSSMQVTTAAVAFGVAYLLKN